MQMQGKDLLENCKLRNIFCFQELDCIVSQMMSVAEYLGWDVSELKPVSTHWCHSVDFVIHF